MSQSLRSHARAYTRRTHAFAASVALMGAACSDPTSSLAPRGTPRDLPTIGLITVGPHGSDAAPGTLQAPLSLEKAVAKATAGTTIQLLPGTYHTGNLIFTRPVTIQPAPGAKVVLSGSEPVPVNQWEPAGSGWRTRLIEHTDPHSVADAEPAVAATDLGQAAIASASLSPVPGSRHLAFVDEKPLTPARSPAELRPGTYYADTAAKWLYVGDNPATHVVEASTHASGVTLAAANSSISGVVMQHFSSIGLRVSASNVRISHSNFSYNGLIGLDINGVSNVTVDNSTMTHNGQVGVEVSHSSNLTFSNNNISYNNTHHYNPSGAAAGLKVTAARNVVIRDNWVQGNAANALWIDVNTQNTTIARNTVLGNQCYGIYFELSDNALVVGNIVHDNWQTGIGIHFTSNARLYNNTLVNNGTNIDVSASYHRAPWDLSHAVIVNNLLWNAGNTMMNLYRWNGCNSWVYSEVDYNAYYRPGGSRARTEVNWCNSHYSTMWNFQRTGHESHGIEYDGGGDPFFVNVGRGDYRLHGRSPAIGRGQGLPWDAASALGVRPWSRVNIGAL